MNKISNIKVKNIALIISIAPAAVMFLILIPFLVFERMNDRANYLISVGETTAEYIALSIEHSLAVGDREYAQNILDKAMNNLHISHVVIEDALGNPFVARKTDLDSIVVEKQIIINSLPEETFQQLDALQIPSIHSEKKILGKVILGMKKEDLSDSIAEIVANGMFLGVIAVLLSIIAGIVVGRIITKPLMRLIASVKELRKNNYDISISSDSTSEIGELTSDINSLAKELSFSKKENEKYVMELIEAKDHCEKIVIERTAELEISRDKAVLANERKNKFLTHISHEFRTPLQAIISYMSLLSSNKAINGSQEIQSDIESVNFSCKVLLERVNEILEYKSIEQEYQPMFLEKIDINEKTNNVANSLKSLARLNNNIIEVSVDENECPVVTDKYKIKKVLINIISNACKYTKNGIISINVNRDKSQEDHICISIIDNGIGISENEMDTIFSPFVRANSENSNVKGTGLGLAICKELMKMLDGTITVSSKIGEGTEVEIRIPIHNKDTKESVPTVLEKIQFSSDKKILLVDDDEIIQTVLPRILKNRGHTITCARNGIEALNEIEKRVFDLIILDLNMPDKSGREVIDHLENTGFNSTPIIVLTADASEETKNSISKLNVTLLHKPINTDELERQIYRHTIQNEIVDAERNMALLSSLDIPKEAIQESVEHYVLQVRELAEIITDVDINKNKVTKLIHRIRGTSKTLGAVRIERAIDSVKVCGDDNDATSKNILKEVARYEKVTTEQLEAMN